jgi:hypothetical protein
VTARDTLRARGESVYLVGDNKASRSLNRIRYIDSDRNWPVDATLMLRRRHGPVQWKVMDKLFHAQHPDGSRVKLPDEEKRARIGGTLNQTEIADMGIGTVDDMSRISFTQLQGRYFRLMLPSFSQPTGRPAAVARHFETLRHNRFSSAGVPGLVLLDAAHFDYTKRSVGWLNRDLRSRQLSVVRAPLRQRSGSAICRLQGAE